MVLGLTCLLGSGGFNPLATAAPPPDRFLEPDLVEKYVMLKLLIIKLSNVQPFCCNKTGTIVHWYPELIAGVCSVAPNIYEKKVFGQ